MANLSAFSVANLTFFNTTAQLPDNDLFHNFLQAYCINPPSDTCDFPFRCPNSDAAGILVRVAAYITTFCLGTVIIFNREDAKDSFANQLFYIYSILITSTISIAQVQITRFHTEIIGALVGSPLSLALLAYALLGFFNRNHRLSAILGPGYKTLIYRMMVIAAFALWLFGIIFMRTSSQFAQRACDENTPFSPGLVALLLIPYSAVVVLIIGAVETNVRVLVLAAPVVLLLIFFIGAVFLQRHTIGGGAHGKSQFWHAWDVISHQYPFIHGCGIHFLPTFYWILVIEAILQDPLSHDNHFELTFGGILAILVIVQPLCSMVKMTPRLWAWFIDLTWVRFLTCRLHRRKPRVHPLDFGIGVGDKGSAEANKYALSLDIEDMAGREEKLGKGMIALSSGESFSSSTSTLPPIGPGHGSER